MKKFAYISLLFGAALIAACSGNGRGDNTPAVVNDTITIADSMSYSGSTAEITINGLYPAPGRQPLVDSIRAWIADCLSWGAFTTEKQIIHASRQEIADGRRLLDHVNQKLLAAAKRDFIYLEGDGVTAGYEYQINFGPDFQSDSLITYEYQTYSYQGGAHGGAILRAATFVIPSGKRLTFGNVFRPEARKELINMVRNGIWQQYFQPAKGQDGVPQTLKEALLIEPEALDLPICGPQFGAEGVTFTYGQYEIAPYASGMPSCTLPYSQLQSMMRPEILPLLPVKSE
ncbi:MAG: RsiV family protein [Bacteroides sp.]|nr:RsiV family protein [Bacteroides sp.]MCM1379652.1 RsiV family protein [Bacteroides sp.]MCM1445966.1 RsiV family protein [Prevotella sp.]